jgi:uncharacterized iron-regulated membrane protein
MFRKALFWLHLSAGAVAGLVILMMSVTGVLLAWQRQVIRLADRDVRSRASKPVPVRKSPEELLGAVIESRHALPTGLTFRSDAAEPASAEFGRGTVVYFDICTGAVLGEGSAPIRRFFREVQDWHRWLAAGIASRQVGRGITGASNLLFLGLLLSGFYLWLPRSRTQLRAAIWFRRGLPGKARDWNWHNTIGIWSVTPLVVIVASGVVMSYGWANDLVYRITGNEPPTQGPGRGNRERSDIGAGPAFSMTGINAAWQRAEAQVPGWKSITLRVPPDARAPLSFTIDSGDGGRPDLRAQLTVRRLDAEVIRWEPFAANNAGRRLRSWIRFAHTGEAGGSTGQAIAALASLGGVFLVWTGLSLAVRRLWAAVAHRRKAARACEVVAR